MNRFKMTVAACLMCFVFAPLFAQNEKTAGVSVEDRVRKLENDLRIYKENYAALDALFKKAVALAESLLEKQGAFAEDLEVYLEKNRALTSEVDRTLEESKAVIDFLKNKVYERPTLLFETELSWHILLGAEVGFSFVWEPLPWLGFRAGAELWYTDSFRPAFPLSLLLRFGLDSH
ncbi:MAG: hypothetical protein JXD23_13825 [Spirochaetales bacterium]|nr:hypothetical protein [Spirochaetales bacterium]